MNAKRIVLTGGGTAGHVTPNLALLPGLKALGFEAHYIGGIGGIEEELAVSAGLPYYGISAGKLRRYISAANVTDAFRVIKGLADARRVLKQVQPDLVFSKGGFVTVPVAFAAGALKIPLILHESDITPGLANRLSLPMAERICVTFPETAARLPASKTIVTGAPIRAQLFEGSRLEGRRFCGLDGLKPVLLAIGGSLGSAALNAAIRAALDELTETFDVVHICGKGRLDDTIQNTRYRQFEYIHKELPHVFQLADVVVSRAGSGSINELLALAKPALLVPLSKKASRGDQILNAESFEKRGYAMTLREEELTAASLIERVVDLYLSRGAYIAAMKAGGQTSAVDEVLRVIHEVAWNSKA